MKMLSQLACGRCGARFWPERGASSLPVIPCADCGALHANPPAVWDTERLLSSDWNRSAVWGEWTRWFIRHWADPLPPTGCGLWMRPFLSVHMRTIDGFACCVIVEDRMRPSSSYRNGRFGTTQPSPPNTMGLVIGWRSNAPPGSANGTWGKFGHFIAVRGQQRPETVFAQLREAARIAGCEPIHPLEEVSHPTPLRSETHRRTAQDPEADRRLESEIVRCTRCGAPSFVVELIGEGRCGFCGDVQPLSPELRVELRAYQRRVHVAQAAAPIRAPVAWTEAAAPIGHVKLACAHCGAPNAHRPGATDERCRNCHAALVPSERARARGYSVEYEAAVSTHAHAVLAEQARFADVFDHAPMTDSFLRIFAGVCLGTLALYVVLGTAGLVTGNLRLLTPLTVLTPLAALVFAIGWFRRRTKLGAIARSEPRYRALTEQLRARRLAPFDLRTWTKRWWSGRVPPHVLRSGPTWCGLEWRLAGFPLALSSHVEVIHPPFSVPGQAAPAHITLLLAGTPPRDVRYWEEQPKTQAAMAHLAALGFDASIHAGGLSARAQQAWVAAARSDHDRVTVVAPVAHALVRLACVLGIEPVGAAEP